MRGAESKKFEKGITFIFTLILWIITAWLIYPLINLDSVNMSNAKEYLYRSIIGITIMLIFFGKTLFDLVFPYASSQKMSILNTIFLTIYSIILASGIIFIITRMILLYLKSRKSDFLF
jgi:hypothetical protein